MNRITRLLFIAIVTAAVLLGLTPGASLSQVEGDLHKAAEAGDLSAMQERIGKGDDVNGRDQDGFTPLMLAAAEGKVEAIHLLLRKGADINARIEAGRLSGFTALIGAVGARHAEAARALIQGGADFHAKFRGRYSPLVMASAAGLKEVVDLLLQKGADRTNLEKDVAEWTKVEWAEKHNVQSERMQLEVALKNAYSTAQMYFMEKPNSMITSESQLVEFGWKNYYEGIVFVRADLSETAGSIVLRNKYLDEANSVAAGSLQAGEGRVDFNGELKLPSPK